MEETKSSNRFDDEEGFYDAAEDFTFFDCLECHPESIKSHGNASISYGKFKPSPEDNSPPSTGLRRRRSKSHDKHSVGGSSELSEISSAASVDSNLRERKTHASRNIRDSDNKLETSESMKMKNRSDSPKSGVNGEKNEINEEHSAITDANANAPDDLERDESSSRGSNETNSSLLFMLAGIVIKPISFQISLIVKVFMFPIYAVYYLYMLVFNPFGVLMHCRGYLIQKLKSIWKFVFRVVLEYMYEWLKEHLAIWKMGVKCGWGLLWSAYVCVVLLGLLVSAFVMGGILIRMVVEEPIRIERSLNFDYSEKSPVAFVPIITDGKLNDNMYLAEKPEILKPSGSRVLQLNHGLRVTVSLTIPESEYNQHLGIFQVRVDFLAADGKTLKTSRRPCMLQYRSHSIRFLLTLLKVAPILTGYTSETQNLKISFKDFSEGKTPTAGLRVVIEQRAEYSTGAGIPEIYSASLTLESELPLLKRILWFWKKTLFIWVSMWIFMVELAFALLCCRPIIIPRIRLRETNNQDASQNNRPAENYPITGM